MKNRGQYPRYAYGVRQGCVLSPYLFNIYTEIIFRETADFEGVTLNGLNVNNARYADDTAILSKGKEKLQNIVHSVKRHGSEAGLDMNVDKTKTMIISEHPGTKIDIKVDGTSLEQVDRYTYLGTQVTDDGRNETEIKCSGKNKILLYG